MERRPEDVIVSLITRERVLEPGLNFFRTGCLKLHRGVDLRRGLQATAHESLSHFGRSYKVRFNSVSSYSDSRKSSGDGPDLRDNFESAGPLANVR